MVQHHRFYFHQPRKGESEKQQKDYVELHSFSLMLKSKLGLLHFLLFFSLFSSILLFAPRFLFYSLRTEEDPRELGESRAAPCAAVANNTICCDRTAFRTDVCFMRGDVRTHSPSKSMLLFRQNSSGHEPLEERIRPYTRKWETGTMDTIDELRLRTADHRGEKPAAKCDVTHDVPAIVFSTGGYTGNVYHEFNDGIIPLYITSQRFNRKVVFVILEYHDWWITKYGDVIARLSDHPPIDFSNDPRTHCFPEAIVGLRIHDELTVDAARMESNKTIRDFRQLLDEAFAPRVQSIIWGERKRASPSLLKAGIEENESAKAPIKPKLVIVSRNGSRAIENEASLVKLAELVGFEVGVVRPQRTTELAEIYRALNSCDAMVGVHGAAMTHFLFMRPGSVFVQIVPLGTRWAAETYYGEPAKKLGLRYVAYGILPRESTLYAKYDKGDPVLRDPEAVNARGWEVTKKIYLEGQNVRLDMGRFRRRLVRAHQYLASKRAMHRARKQDVEGS